MPHKEMGDMTMKFECSRRPLLAWSAAALVAGTALTRPVKAQTPALQTLKFGLANKSMSPTSAPFALPECLGYYKQEGLTVEVVPLGSDASLAAALDQGRLDVMVGVPSFLLPLLAKGEKVNFVNYFEYTYPFKWAIAVKPGSDIKQLSDLKGKTIGVSNFGTSDFAVGKTLLRMVGIDPQKQMSWIAVGEGTTAGRALDKGDIAALIYYDTGFGTIEGAGIKLRYIPLPADVPKVGGLYIATQAGAIMSKRKSLVGFARAVAKAEVFMQTNPDAAAYALLTVYPDMGPVGKTMREKVAALAIPIRKRDPILSNYDKSVNELGQISKAEVAADVKFLGLDGKLKIDDAWRMYTNDLIPEINQFDRKKIREQARNYKLPYK
jgi:NitT/TauT family transport system substrate-binding protein